MDNSIPKLTIVIPTYNRKDGIQEQVRRLLPQLTSQIHLIIIDNNSPYDIKTLFSDEELKHFDVFVNKYNIGGDANIAKCFEVCDTEWLWTLSDDDLVQDDAVQSIIEDISHINKDVIFINYHRSKTSLIIGLTGFLSNSRVEYWRLFWMSSCLYNLTLLNKYMLYYYSSLSTMQPGVFLLFHALKSNPNFIILFSQKVIIQNSSHDISWNRESYVYASLFLVDLLTSERKLISKSLLVSIVNLCFWCLRDVAKNTKSRYSTFSLFLVIIKRVGIVYSFHYCFKSLLSCCYHILSD